MNRVRCKQSKNKKINIKKEDIHNWPKLKNYKQIKIDYVNNIREDNFNIENQRTNRFMQRKKLLAEFYPSNI
jgi:hypothetical protein